MICSLCDLKEIKTQEILETKHERVMYNKYAMTKGQCLVVPKKHIENIRELSKEERESLIETVQKVSNILNTELNPLGFNYGFNEGKIAGQKVNHLHIHIIPRYHEEEISLIPKPKIMKKLSEEQLISEVKQFTKIFSTHLKLE